MANPFAELEKKENPFARFEKEPGSAAEQLATGVSKRAGQISEAAQGFGLRAGEMLGIVSPERLAEYERRQLEARSVFSPEYRRFEAETPLEYVGGMGLDVGSMLAGGGTLKALSPVLRQIPGVGGRAAEIAEYTGGALALPRTVPQAGLGGALYSQTYPYTSLGSQFGTSNRRYGNIAIAPNGDIYAVTDNNAPTAGNVYKYNPSINDFELWGGLPNRTYLGITVTPSNDVYISVINGDIYKQTNGSGAFVALNQTNRNWRGMVSDLNGSVYACVYGGDIYKQTNGTGNFVAMGAGNRNWHSIMVSTDNYLYAAVRYGDVYKSPMNTINFTSLNLGNKEWYAMTNKLY